LGTIGDELKQTTAHLSLYLRRIYLFVIEQWTEGRI
jgi:hypothetical protein